MDSRERAGQKATTNRPILVVDDDPQSRALVAAILSEADFEVLAVADGAAGIALARKVQPAVIILDIMLPGMDGITILQNLKREPDLKDIPVIGITGSTDLTCAEKAFRAGAQFFLPKPFRAASLLSLVELAVDRVLRDTPMQRRRRHPRHPAEIPVTCVLGAEGETSREVTGSTGNVSLSGLLLLLPVTVATGTDMHLRMELPEGPVTARGRVLWQDPDPTESGRFQHGIRLLGFAEGGALAQYRRYLSQLTQMSVR